MAQMQYFRSRISGLVVVTGEQDPTKGEVAPEHVKFEEFVERYQGDKVRVGYLATDNQTAIAKLKKDPNVEEIKEKEYEDATGEKAQRAN